MLGLGFRDSALRVDDRSSFITIPSSLRFQINCSKRVLAANDVLHEERGDTETCHDADARE